MPGRALIIGGGIGGLATAIALRDAGFDVSVYERARELKEVGAGLGLWPNALMALDALGVTEAIERTGLPDIRGSLLAADGTVLMNGAATPAGARLIHRAELLDILLARLGAVHVTLAADCVTVGEDEGGVTAQFRDGRRAEGDLLVGADGLHSVVRTHLHGAQPPHYAGYTCWRAAVPFDHAKVIPAETWGRGARFGVFPINGGRIYWYAALTTPEGERSPDGEQALLRRVFRGWHAPIEAIIDATPERAILRNDIYDRPPLAPWGRGRLTLVGDAAHPMTPNLGQGACQALEDAVVLARSLGDGSDIAATLRRYESVRSARTAPLVKQSRQVGWVGHWRNPIGAGLRNFLVRQIAERIQPSALDRITRFDVRQS